MNETPLSEHARFSGCFLDPLMPQLRGGPRLARLLARDGEAMAIHVH